ISPEGLLLTNHHCGYGAIQQHSSVEHDYLQDGFWAMNRKEELPTPGLKVEFIDKIEDVTEFVQQALAADTTKKEMDYLSPLYMRKLVKKKTSENKPQDGISIEIKPLYGGNKYYMFTKKIYNDVRMVGAPPSSIGKFGADTDNWMWPRHTGDFSLFRIYGDKNGNPAPYSEENVPLRVKKWFPISMKGIEPGDYAMIMGFPGSTNRFYTSGEVASRRDITNKTMINVREERQKVLLNEMLADPQVRIQYASKYAGSSNYHKNAIGMNDALNRLQVIDRKTQEETAFAEWAAKNDNPEYAKALATINELTAKTDSIKQLQMYLRESLMAAIEFSRIPEISNALSEGIRTKNQEVIDNELKKLKKAYQSFANKDYNATVDKKVARVILEKYMKEVPVSAQPTIFSYIRTKYKGNIDSFLDACFNKSIFASKANFERFVKKPTIKAIQQDEMLRYASSVKDKMKELTSAMAPYNVRLSNARKTYIAGLLEMAQEKPVYPDANFTLRMTYGKVLPYDPKDGVTYHYYTTLNGVMEKEDPNNWEFVVPEKLKQLWLTKNYGEYALADGRMPVNFLSSNDITGGNSGSPVINAKGELIGCAFDGNWEAMSGDIVFEPNLQRTINVDIRYILFIIDKYAGASHLIDEMDIIK
ncbi:MAG: S46 family peptidase, partial [Bacteroidales bacterium]